jgi:hypothetical protein
MAYASRIPAASFRIRRDNIFILFSREERNGVTQGLVTSFLAHLISIGIRILLFLLGDPVSEATHLIRFVKRHQKRTATTSNVTKANKSDVVKS